MCRLGLLLRSPRVWSCDALPLLVHQHGNLQKDYDSFQPVVFISTFFLQKAEFGNDEPLKKCFFKGLNFICGNLPDTCIV